MTGDRFKGLWANLQGKKPHFPHFLTDIELAGIRGINHLRVKLEYPVSVIAGENASGKSTVLFAAACAYKVPGAGVRDFVPSTIFPDFRPTSGNRIDKRSPVKIEYSYETPEGRFGMVWRRSKGWNRSFLGRKNASQPSRPVYLRTLSNLSNPAEVRGVLSMSRLKSALMTQPMTARQIDFAERVLPFRYSEVVDLSSRSKHLLFATQELGASYSELHMSAGERTMLRLSQEIAQIRGALVLIDEVEAGLHPWAQELLMLELHHLALRNDLQIVVTSHSPVVLNCVPKHGRIFLQRDRSGNVVVKEPYRDVIQQALYGRSRETLKLLCEDDTAESVVRGVLDVLLHRHRISMESVHVARDTGAEEFPSHASAFRRVGLASSFVFVLDGDKRDSHLSERIKDNAGSTVHVLFLPGDAPETWVWTRLKDHRQRASGLGIDSIDLRRRMDSLDQVYASASDSTSRKAKIKLHNLGTALGRSSGDICRIVARWEMDILGSAIHRFANGLEDALLEWRDR